MSWKSGLVSWEENNIVYISVVFSWQLQQAYQMAIWHQGKKVRIGGPSSYLKPEMFEGIAEIGGEIDAIAHHNPQATFTSRGCIRSCPFCIVPKIEGELRELKDWPIYPIICDNNFLATSKKHFDSVIDKLKPLKNIDFNQGLDARLMTKYHAERLRELNIKVIRLAWDHSKMEKQFMYAWNLLRSAGFPKSRLQAYVLMGYNDTPEDALYRLQSIKELGGLPNPMRYQPIDAIRKNEYVHPNWTEYELKAYMRYWSKQQFLRSVPFAEYLEGYKISGHPETLFN